MVRKYPEKVSDMISDQVKNFLDIFKAPMFESLSRDPCYPVRPTHVFNISPDHSIISITVQALQQKQKQLDEVFFCLCKMQKAYNHIYDMASRFIRYSVDFGKTY